MMIGQHHFNTESDLIRSMLNHDSSIIPSSSKIDSLLDEFAGELTLLKSIPPGVDKTECHPENEIRLSQRLLYDNSSPHILLIKRLLYDNSSPRPPEEFVSENSNADIESFSPSPIPVEDSDFFMEEIDLSFNPDDPMPPCIEEDDYESERDILICEELLDNYSLSLPVIESYHFDIPSFSRRLAKPPDGNTGILNIKMIGDISEQKVPMPGLMITLNIPILDVPLFYFTPLDQLKYGGNWVKLSDLKQALRGRHPMLILIQYSRKCEDSCQRILSSKSSFPQLQLAIHDSFMEEIDLTFTPDDPMPPGIEDDDDDSERDILIHEEFLDNYSLSLPVNESFHFDIPSFSRPPAKPPDGNTGILNIKIMGDVSEQKVPMPGLMITLVPNQKKSPDL
nr:hypothetical protein [Tanacetum cinerariifolium]